MTYQLPRELIQAVQRYTQMPWWNGEAYAENKGYPQAIARLRMALRSSADELEDVAEMLRAAKHYPEADRVRTIVQRMRNDSQDRATRFMGVVRRAKRPNEAPDMTDSDPQRPTTPSGLASAQTMGRRAG